MTFGELLGAILGWLGELIEFIISFVPRITIVQWNERGVRYVRGLEPTEIEPGVWWYWPWCTEIEKHHVNRRVLDVEDLSLETGDGKPVQVGMVLTYHITDVLRYEVENFEPDENMAVAAQGALRDVVLEFTWEELTRSTEEGKRLAGQLKSRMGRSLEKFGVAIETCRPNDQIKLRLAARLFGVSHAVNIGPTSS